MKKAIALLALACACGSARAADETLPAPATSATTVASAPAAAAQLDPGAVALTPDPMDQRREALRRYVLSIMQGWTPAVKIETVPLEDLAADIAAVAAADKPAWPGDTTGRRTAVLLAGLAYFEGARFAKYVDDGTCNEPKFREHNPLAHYGTCDHGHAHSLWQIHEITLLEPREEADAVSLADRRFAAHIALRLARQSIAATGGLRNYTGEWDGPCPKADARLEFIEKAIATHPFTP